MLASMGCGSSSTSATDGGTGGKGGDTGGAGGKGGGAGGKGGGVGGSMMTGGSTGTCGNLPACLATLFNAGCFPSTTAGPCTKMMVLTATTQTYTYCFANHTKFVLVSDVASGDQNQTYSNDSGTCFTATVVPNGPETYFDPAGTAEATEMTTIPEGGSPLITVTCTGGSPVVVTDTGSCEMAFNISLCTTDPSCQ